MMLETRKVADGDETRVIDPAAIDQLRELQVEGDPDVLGELIGMYLTDTEQRIDTIQAAVSEERHTDVERGAHALAGGSAVFGADALIAVCRQLQAAGRSGDLGPARELVERLRVEFDRLQVALSQEITTGA